MVTAAAVFAVVSCGGSDAAEEAPTTVPDPAATPDSVVTTDAVASDAVAPDSVPELQDGASLTHDSPIGDTSYSWSIGGIVDLGPSLGHEPGSCFAVLATLEATRSEAVEPNYSSAPPISLHTAEGLEARGLANCDSDGLSSAGYSLIDVAKFPVGETVSVYYPFVVDASATVDSIVVGHPLEPESTWEFFDAVFVQEIPPAPS